MNPKRLNLIRFKLLLAFILFGIGYTPVHAQCVINTINPSFELPGGFSNFKFIPESQVPGWHTTDTTHVIEVWKSGFKTVPAYDGNFFIELNATMPSAVYQDYDTPNPLLFMLHFAHRGRESNVISDVCKVSAGPVGGPYVEVLRASDTNKAWGVYNGSYLVPAGQVKTRFYFEAVTSAGGISTGNFLDAIVFTGKTPLPTLAQSTKSYCLGDIPVPLDSLVKGDNLLWYTTAVGGVGTVTAPKISTQVPGITHTYITQSPSGCESDRVLLTTIVNPPTASTTQIAICAGDSYTFNGINYTSAGTYLSHLTNAAGCDSTATLVLSIKQPSSSTSNGSICAGDSISFNGVKYSTAGTYVSHLTNAAGCDSVASLVLSIKQPSTSTTKASICLGDSITFNGVKYKTAGTYLAHLTNAVGCDSVASLVLSIKQPSSSTTQMAICFGDSITFNSVKYKTAGTYQSHLTNAAGCDSVASLVLTVKQPSASTTQAAICSGERYTFNGVQFNTAGTYVAHLANAAGCDSVANLVLTIKQPSSSITQAVICMGDTYTFNGVQYKTAGTYISNLTNAVGCDSVASLVLSIKQPSNSTTNAVICSGESYNFNGETYHSAGSYVVHLTNAVGCDSAANLVLNLNPSYNLSQTIYLLPNEVYTINGNSYDKDGSYTDVLKTVNSCDSTIITEIIVLDLPNTFTPNGDGMNDVFAKGKTIEIYNRNNILLYKGDEGWNGTFNGNYVSNDTYFFVLHFVTKSGKTTKKGFVTLFR